MTSVLKCLRSDREAKELNEKQNPGKLLFLYELGGCIYSFINHKLLPNGHHLSLFSLKVFN
jgi:hypothetical protein